jgi:pyruvate dehydrogenase phosphatase
MLTGASSCAQGIAKRLVKAALQEVAKKREMRYADLKKIEPGVRRFFHDDISVVVVFLDHNRMGIQGSLKERACKIFMNSVNAPVNIFSSDKFRTFH